MTQVPHIHDTILLLTQPPFVVSYFQGSLSHTKPTGSQKIITHYKISNSLDQKPPHFVRSKLKFEWVFPMIAMWGKEKTKVYITHNFPNIHKTTPNQFKQPCSLLIHISFSGKQREPSNWLRGIWNLPYSISKYRQGLRSVNDGALLWEDALQGPWRKIGGRGLSLLFHQDGAAQTNF